MSVSLQKDTNSELLKSYIPPFKGDWRTLPPYLLPDDAVQDSFNVTLIGGKLRSRCGLASYNTTNLLNKVIGSFLTVDTSNKKYPIVSTNNKVYRLVNSLWEDITNNTFLSAPDTQQVRMSSLQLGSYVYILYANGSDTLKVISQVDYKLKNITPYQYEIPICTDICTTFSRFIGITPPYTVTWCDILNNTYPSFTNWPPENQVILADTEDSLVTLRPLGTLGVSVYKEGNIFLGFAQSGSNSQAFRFEHRGEYEGPANPNALVNANGTHIYMTRTGRIARFDGTAHNFIADGLWPYLQDNLDPEYTHRIFGVYNYRTAEVYFWYPRVGDSGLNKGLVIIDTPFPLAGVTSYASFLGASNFDCSNGLSIRQFSSLSSPFIFGNNNQTFLLDKASYLDNISSFPCSFKPGLFKPTPNPDARDKSSIYRPTLELYATRGIDKGLVNVSAVTSHNLENTGVSTIPEVIDLTRETVNEYIGFNESGSFLGAELTWDSTAKFEYMGLDIYGRQTT